MKKIGFIFLLMLLSIIFSGCGKNNTNINNSQNQNLNKVAAINENDNINSNANTEIDTSDWQTYTNEEYGFSFKYPSEDKVTEFSDYIVITTPKTEEISQETTGERSDAVSILFNENNFLFGGLPKPIEFTEEYYKSFCKKSELDVFLGEIKIDGHNAFQLSHEEATKTKHTFLKNNNEKYIEIYGGYYGAEVSDLSNNKLEPYDAIVNSIKFID